MIRLLDILFSGVALVCLFPLFFPVVIILKLTGEREVLYLQERVGLNGKIFKLFKFVTMVKDSPNLGSGEVTIKNDPRVLPFGKFLRKSKINELPQLLNIFKGDMSTVGPRPMVENTFKRYGSAGSAISKVKPGLTGIGSIVFRDEEKYLESHNDPIRFYIEEIIPYKVELELWYIKRKSIFLYFILIYLTAWSLIAPNSNLYKNLLRDLPPLPNSLINL